MATTRKYKKSKMSRKNKKSKSKIQYGCSNTTKRYLAQKGGSSFLPEFSNKVLPPVPPPLVGLPWTPTSIGNSNYYAKNGYNAQVDYNPSQERNQIKLSVNPWGKMWGGKRKHRKHNKSKTKRYKGGTIFNKIMPSDILNIGRTTSWNVGNLYNGYNGYQQTVSPLPWVQPSLLKPISIPKHI